MAEVRLIDANALDALEDLKYIYRPVCNGDAWYRAEDVWKCIGEQPTIDPESLRPKGRWIWNEEDECWVCSNCELSALNNYRGNSTDSNYRPNCGAQMTGGG